MAKKIISKKYYLFCLLIAFFVLLCTSKNSFLYGFNDWVDANAFFTVGKGMMNGVVPYKDLFEQKGLLLYVIYGIGYLFCHKAFYGVFILEVISFSVFLYYAHKIFKMFLDEKYSLILLPIISYLITTSRAFVHGGSCEEFALAFLAVSLYYYFKHFKESKLTNKEVLINGIMFGIVFMMKYTMIGLWIGFGLFIFIDYLLDKKVKEAFKFCLYFLLGALIPIGISFIYLFITGAVDEFIQCYFIINMTAYSDNSTGVIDNIFNLLKLFLKILMASSDTIFCLFLILPLFTFNIQVRWHSLLFKIGLLSMFLFEALVIYWGLKDHAYYFLPMLLFLIVSLMGIANMRCLQLSNLLNTKFMHVVFIIISILFIYLSFIDANYTNLRSWNKDEFFQFKYAKYINKYENPTLLNMGFLDAGLYTTTGIIPNVRFFEVQNISYDRFPDNLDEMNAAVKNKKVKFVLFYTQKDYDWVKENNKDLIANYKLVYDDKHYFENLVYYNAFLFELND